LEDETEQCQASKGDCGSYAYTGDKYNYVKGSCVSPGTAAGYNHWVADYQCVAGYRQAVCYIEDCQYNNRCGNILGTISCGSTRCGEGELCTFDTSLKDCKCVYNSTKCAFECHADSNPTVSYRWENMLFGDADIVIDVTNPSSNSCYYEGDIKYEVRQNIAAGGDPHCDLTGYCVADDLFGTSDNMFNYQSIKLAPGESTTIRKTFTARAEGDYHFDVWYNRSTTESHYYGNTADVHLTPANLNKCGVNCYGRQCGPCEKCVLTGYSISCEQDDTCSCTGCDNVKDGQTVGSCVCKSGSCVKYYDAECRLAGLEPEGCKCRPREQNEVYFGNDGCTQSGCGIFEMYLPREAACRCPTGCGSGAFGAGTFTCGDKKCSDGEKCVFVQEGSSGTDYTGHCNCTPAAECKETLCGDGIDNDGDGKTDCADEDCNGVAPCICSSDADCCKGDNAGRYKCVSGACEQAASGGVYCCVGDADCVTGGVTCGNSETFQDSKRYAMCYIDNTCSECGPCVNSGQNPDCADYYCCPADIDNLNYVISTLDRTCKALETKINWAGKSYICTKSGFIPS